MKKTQTDINKNRIQSPEEAFAPFWPSITRIMMALTAAGGEARLVGGCVRDVLMKRALGDIDMACTLPPEQVMEALDAAKIHVVPTGLAFGTITAVIDKKGFEITSLRADIDPDGRHTKVAYTDDWATDAARRDFTINALYMDEKGEITDFTGGLQDIKEGRLRFIGRATDRLKEDVLRLLRYFRFMAQLGFSEESLEEEDIEACAAMASQMEKLSAERVQKEIMLLFAAKNPVPVLKLMEERGILTHLLPFPYDWARFENLVKEAPDPLLRWGALLKKGHSEIAGVLKLSNKKGARLSFIGNLPDIFYKIKDERDVRQLLYDYGREKVLDAFSLMRAEGKGDFSRFVSLCQTWKKPILPLTGKDLMDRGYSEGPQMGQALEALTRFWRGKDFTPDRAQCLKYLEALKARG